MTNSVPLHDYACILYTLRFFSFNYRTTCILKNWNSSFSRRPILSDLRIFFYTCVMRHKMLPFFPTNCNDILQKPAWLELQRSLVKIRDDVDVLPNRSRIFFGLYFCRVPVCFLGNWSDKCNDWFVMRTRLFF